MKDTPLWRRMFRLGRPDVERDVKDEVGFHLDMQVRDLMRDEGMTQEDAETEALRRFGDVARVERSLLSIGEGRERGVRRTQLVDDALQDVRFAVRQLRKRPVFAVVTVFILGLGIGANAAVFSVVDGSLLRPLPLPDERELVYMMDAQEEQPGFPSSWPEYEDWRREGARFAQAIAAFASNAYTVQFASGPESVTAGLIGGDFQEVLGLPPLIGRSFDAAELEAEAHVLMLSEWMWRQRFARDANVLGQTLVIDGESFTIIGVMPNAADVLVNRRELAFWRPLFLPAEFRGRGFHLLRVSARVHSGLSLEEARTRAASMAAGLRDSGATRHGLTLEPVRETLVGDARPLLLALLGAVLFLLVIVCANLSNLFLLRSSSRTREFAVRTAIGAGRMRLVRQLLTETVLLGIVGGAIGLLLSRLATGLVAAISAQAGALAPESSVDLRVIVFTTLLSLAAAMVSGLWPALRANRQDVAVTLKDSDAARAAGHRSQRRSRNILVASELALSVVLLAGAGLMVKSVFRLLSEDPGFRPQNVLAVSIALSSARYPDERQAQFFEDLITRLHALPGVRAVAGVSHLPLGGDDTNGGFGIAGRQYPEGQGPYSKKRIAMPGYFQTLGIPLLRGRDFDERDRAGGREVVVISEAIAQRYWPGEDPIGQEIQFSWGPGERHEIIGIVGDVKHDGLDVEIEGAIYRPLAQFPRPALNVVVRAAGDALALTGALRHEVRALDPLQPLRSVTTMEAVLQDSISNRRTVMVLLGVFAGIALVLTVMGVYTVTAESVGQRRREIGVRMAIGAQRTDVLRLIIGEEILVVAVGVLMGVAGAFAVTRFLTSSLFGVTATDATTFATVAGLLTAIAVLAIYVPARRAARVDPAIALRTN